METKKTIYRKDYKAPDFLVPETKLYLDIREDYVEVSSRMILRFDGEGRPEETPLLLNAENMEILSVEIDGRKLSGGEYDYAGDLLTLKGLAAESIVATRVRIDPYNNTRLMGFYKSGDILCTQCEAEGFRRITPFQDHPDVLSRYTTTLEGTAPVLLSNGNLIEETKTDEGRRVVTWEDPFPKPSYLFAAVAGDLGRIEDSFTTMSGRDIALRIYTDRGNEERARHAMSCLKMAMKWDEDNYGREYDLDLFMIVAVDAFNFGAMENKGLNIFNSAAVLSDREITTDAGLDRISGIVAHEYFHNWTGNRITCRDWFQLTLKEGLTVFRDASYTADTTSAGVARINQFLYLNSVQFPEDAGPNSHPIRPESYREIDNFYTPTVYRKGAEIIRMISLLAGKEGYRKGIDEYFRRHDGQAVTCEDFILAMEGGSGVDLSQFRRWYSQAGTPRITAFTRWSGGQGASRGSARGKLTLFVSQSTPESADGSGKEPFSFPLDAALFGKDGSLVSTERLIVNEEKQQFEFTGLSEEPVVSLLRGFSAPVIMNFSQTDEDLFFLLTHETDPYSRYRAVKVLYEKIIRLEIEKEGSGQAKEEALQKAFRTFLENGGYDSHFVSLLLTLPSLDEIGAMMESPDYIRAYRIRQGVKERMGQALESIFLPLYETLTRTGSYEYNREQVGGRALKGVLLEYLVCADRGHLPLASKQYFDSDNMTDASSALNVLCDYGKEEKEKALNHYYERWENQFLPLTAWFAYQSGAAGGSAYDDILRLEKHEKYDGTNPNMIRALYGAFTANRPEFHHPSGRGYKLIAERVISLDKVNRGVAASLAKMFLRYPTLGPELQVPMKEALESILAVKDLSAGVQEVVENTLKA